MGDAPQRSSAGSRRAIRTSTVEGTSIEVHRADASRATLDVCICDISAFGVGLIAGIPLECGGQFTLKLASRGADEATLLYRVAYCVGIDNHQFRVGAEFICKVGHPDQSRGVCDDTLVERVRQAILSASAAK
jgi:hypothetical protein